jgi:hypothetical protein
MLIRVWSAAALLGILQASSSARADPSVDSVEDAVEDQLVDGDIDSEDRASAQSGGHSGSSDVRAQSWVSLVGFTKQLMSGKSDTGGMVVVGLALDRVAARPAHGLTDPVHVAPPPSPPTVESPPHRAQLVAPSFARACVAAALRASGLGVDDSRIDALVARARASALLPETRMRAMRLMTDAAHDTTLATTDGTTYYDAVGANLVLELRLTWRLDRLLFAGDETAFERTRLERENARSRLAARTLELLFAWRRAGLEAEGAESGSPEELQARLRESEALATLDVLTSGWFSRQDGQ